MPVEGRKITICRRCGDANCISRSKDVPCARWKTEASPQQSDKQLLTPLQALREGFLRLCQQYTAMGEQLKFLSEVVTTMLEQEEKEQKS